MRLNSMQVLINNNNGPKHGQLEERNKEKKKTINSKE